MKTDWAYCCQPNKHCQENYTKDKINIKYDTRPARIKNTYTLARARARALRGGEGGRERERGKSINCKSKTRNARVRTFFAGWDEGVGDREVVHT